LPFLFFSFDNVDELKTSDINYCFKENLDYVTFGIHLSFVFWIRRGNISRWPHSRATFIILGFGTLRIILSDFILEVALVR